MRKFLFILSLALASPAMATTVYCPGTTATTDREFAVDITFASGSAFCYASGTGNVEGNNADFPGWEFVEKDQPGSLGNILTGTGFGSTAGTFDIAPLVWTQFTELLLTFKSGQGVLDPDWVAFRLTPVALQGDWTISGSQSLSHMNLYGRLDPTVGPFCTTPLVNGVCVTTNQVPEPGSLALMGLGLMGIGFVARRAQNR